MQAEHVFNQLRFWTDRPDFIADLDCRDAELDREDSLSDRYAFQLGENIGICRLTPPDEWPSDQMERGYVHGSSRPPNHADSYLRKLLNLRRSAFARGIPVSSALTTVFLRQVTVTVCPVSGHALTQGTMTDTDWSLDRLENSLGYVPGNVCFVSTRVNRLKGTDDFSPIADEAKRILLQEGPAGFALDVGNGLTVIEALRLAALMCAPSAFARNSIGRYAPFAMAPSVWATPDAVLAGLHVECAQGHIPGSAYSRRAWLIKRLGADVWRASNRLVEHIRAALARGVHPADLWFDGFALAPLRHLTDEFLAQPPELPHLSDDQVLERVGFGMRSLTHYKRLR